MEKIEIGKDYISKDGLIVIDRLGTYGNRGLDGNNFEYDLFCSSPYVWREATKEEVIEAFKKHLIHRYGEDWKTMKIKKRHPSSRGVINDEFWAVLISKEGSWKVWNENGVLYFNGIWVDRLEEEPKIHIKEAIKENTVIHCETEEETNRILGMAHELGYKWIYGGYYIDDTKWDIEESETCYSLIDGTYSDYNYFKNGNYNIIPSTQIADLEPEEAVEKLPINKVTTKNLDMALRMVGIQLNVNIIDKVVDLVGLIENKGDDVTIKDIDSLQQTW